MQIVRHFLKQAYRGIIGAIAPMYYEYRERLRSVRQVQYAGVVVADIKSLDRFFPGTRANVFAANIDDYEQALVLALKSHVRRGMRVVIVGGGVGVTACVAAQCVGETGSVICYEGNLSNYERAKTTARLNNVQAIVQVIPAIVSTDVGVYPGRKAAAIVAPADLPPCDILELDCEGAEASILAGLSHQPVIVIVETHGCTERVSEILTSKRYVVEDRGVAEPRLRSICEIHDIRCLVAVRDDTD